MALHGWFNVDKPLGLTSAQVVGRLQRALRQAGYGKLKIGHGGTLDPLATGVLPVALGEATKLSGYLLDATKGYCFTIGFGEATTTDDREGTVCATSAVRPSRAAIEAALPGFTGAITQIPPAYSALKVDGARAYDLARAGETVVLAPRGVTIFALGVAAIDGTDAAVEAVTLDVLCSKGTYVRALARDLAAVLGTVGHVAMLRRTKAGPFALETAISLDKLDQFIQERRPEQALLPLTAGLDDIPALPVNPEEAAMLRQGQRLQGTLLKPGTYMAMNGSVPIAIVEAVAGQVRVLRGLNVG